MTMMTIIIVFQNVLHLEVAPTDSCWPFAKSGPQHWRWFLANAPPIVSYFHEHRSIRITICFRERKKTNFFFLSMFSVVQLKVWKTSVICNGCLWPTIASNHCRTFSRVLHSFIWMCPIIRLPTSLIYRVWANWKRCSLTETHWQVSKERHSICLPPFLC